MISLRDHGRACTVAHVTTEAKTAKGNFYRYFASWDVLLDAVRDRLLDDYRRRLEIATDDDAAIDWWELTAEEIGRFIDFHVELGVVHEIVFHRPGTNDTSEEQGADEILASLLAAGIKAGAFRAVDTTTMGTLLFHTLHGAADEISRGGDRTRIQQGVTDVFRAVLTT